MHTDFGASAMKDNRNVISPDTESNHYPSRLQATGHHGAWTLRRSPQSWAEKRVNKVMDAPKGSGAVWRVTSCFLSLEEAQTCFLVKRKKEHQPSYSLCLQDVSSKFPTLEIKARVWRASSISAPYSCTRLKLLLTRSKGGSSLIPAVMINHGFNFSKEAGLQITNRVCSPQVNCELGGQMWPRLHDVLEGADRKALQFDQHKELTRQTDPWWAVTRGEPSGWAISQPTSPPNPGDEFQTGFCSLSTSLHPHPRSPSTPFIPPSLVSHSRTSSIPLSSSVTAPQPPPRTPTLHPLTSKASQLNMSLIRAGGACSRGVGAFLTAGESQCETIKEEHSNTY